MKITPIIILTILLIIGAWLGFGAFLYNYPEISENHFDLIALILGVSSILGAAHLVDKVWPAPRQGRFKR